MTNRQIIAFVVMLLGCVVLAELLAQPILARKKANQANLPVITHLDPEIGWRNTPGSQQYDPEVTDGQEVKVTILEDGSRLSSPESTSDVTDTRPSILFVGGSWTFGLGPSDEQTYISRLQQWHPEYRLLNHGVIGYGTAQSYMRLKELLDEIGSTPRLVVYGFISHHDQRNVADPQWIRSLAKDGKSSHQAVLPYCSIKDNELVWNEPVMLKTGLLDKSVLASAVKSKTKPGPEEQQQAEAVTHRLAVEMGHLCKERGTEFLVHFLSLKQDRFERFDAVLAEEQISAFPNTIEMNGHEFDCPWEQYHPGAYAHEQYAINLDRFLGQMRLWTPAPHP